MEVDTYEVMGMEGDWIVSYNGADGMSYATKEAAFEAAVAAASNAVKAGNEVNITVQGAEAGESSLGGEFQPLS